MHRAAQSRRRSLPVGGLIGAQLLVAAALVVLSALLSGGAAALSALSGATICVAGNAYFLWRASRIRGGRQPRRMVNNFYRAAAGKFGLTVALFVAAFVLVPPSNPALFFGAYVATQFAHWLAPWLLRKRSTP